MDAVKELADAAGMEVPAPDPRAQERAERAAGLYEVMAAAEAWFVEQLDGSKVPRRATICKGAASNEATRSGSASASRRTAAASSAARWSGSAMTS